MHSPSVNVRTRGLQVPNISFTGATKFSAIIKELKDTLDMGIQWPVVEFPILIYHNGDSTPCPECPGIVAPGPLPPNPGPLPPNPSPLPPSPSPVSPSPAPVPGDVPQDPRVDQIPKRGYVKVEVMALLESLQQLDLDLSVPSWPPEGKWDFTIGAFLPPEWKPFHILKSLGMSDIPDRILNMVFEVPRVSFSSVPHMFTFPAESVAHTHKNMSQITAHTTGAAHGSFNASQPRLNLAKPKFTPMGLNLHCVIPINTPGTETMADWLKPQLSGVDVAGIIGMPLNFEGDLPVGVAVLDGDLQIRNVVFKLHTAEEPWFVLGAVFSVNLYDDASLDPFFALEGSLFSDHVCVEGQFAPAITPAGKWAIPIGDVELDLYKAGGSVCYWPNGTNIGGETFTITGRLYGSFQLEEAELDVEVEFPSSNGCLLFNISAGLAGGAPLTLGALVNGLLPDSPTVPIMSGLAQEVTSVGFSNLVMTIEPVCKCLYLRASVESSFFLASDIEVNFCLGFSWEKLFDQLKQPNFWSSLQGSEVTPSFVFPTINVAFPGGPPDIRFSFTLPEIAAELGRLGFLPSWKMKMPHLDTWNADIPCTAPKNSSAFMTCALFANFRGDFAMRSIGNLNWGMTHLPGFGNLPGIKTPQFVPPAFNMTGLSLCPDGCTASTSLCMCMAFNVSGLVDRLLGYLVTTVYGKGQGLSYSLYPVLCTLQLHMRMAQFHTHTHARAGPRRWVITTADSVGGSTMQSRLTPMYFSMTP